MANLIKNVPFSYPEAFDRLYHAIINAGWRVSLADPQTGTIRFDSPVCLSDYGFNFNAQVGALDPYNTQLYFTGRPKFGFDAFGAGDRKLEKMMKNY